MLTSQLLRGFVLKNGKRTLRTTSVGLFQPNPLGEDTKSKSYAEAKKEVTNAQEELKHPEQHESKGHIASALSATKDKVIDVAHDVKEKLSNVVEDAKVSAEAAVKMVKDTVTGTPAEASKVIGKAVEKGMNSQESGADQIKDMVDDKRVDQIDNRFRGEPNIRSAEEVISSAKSAGTARTPTGLSDKDEGVTDIAKAKMGDVSNALKDAKDYVKDKVKGVGENVKGHWREVKKADEKFGEELMKGPNQSFSEAETKDMDEKGAALPYRTESAPEGSVKTQHPRL